MQELDTINPPYIAVMKFKPRWIYINLLVLIVLFAISVFVRSGNLNKTLGHPSEWLTGHMLVTLTIWDDIGLSESKFAPRYNFSNPADKHCRSLAGVMDEDLNAYYVSYPPFGFYLPHAVFSVLGVTPDVLPLQIFGMVLHLIATLFVVLLLYELFSKSFRKTFFLPAYAGAAIYLFTPGMLWFHSNIYFVDMLVQVLFIIEIFLLIRLFKRGSSMWLLIWLGIINFLAVYTEWLAVFVAFTACIVTFIWFIKKRQLWAPIIIAATTLSAIGLTFYQYAQLAGTDELIDVSITKYDERSGRSEEDYALTVDDEITYEILEKNYTDEYRVTRQFTQLALWGMLVLIIVARFRRKPFDWVEIVCWLLIVIPILMHYIIFFNFNALHDFGTLKTGFFFAFVAGVFVHHLIHQISSWKPKLTYYTWVPVIVVMFFVSNDNIRFYHQQHSMPPSTTMYDIGMAAKELAKPTDGVYTRVWYNAPEALFYAKRNILSASDVNQAIDFMKVRGEQRGVWIEVNPETQEVIEAYYIYPQ